MRLASAKLAAICASLTALLGAACGAVEETREAEKRKAAAETTATTQPHDAGEEAGARDTEDGAAEGREEAVDAEREPEASVWVTFGWSAASTSSESNGPPLASRLSIFSRPRRPTDAVPQQVLELAEADGSDMEEFEGKALLDESRLAIGNAGSRNVDVYLVPTSKGFVCTYVADPTDEFAGGHGGCAHALAPEGYTIEMSGSEHSLEVEGLVEDSVQSVEVEVWGRRIDAEAAGNAYYLDTTLDKSCPEAVDAIVLHSSSGTRRIALDDPPAPSGAGGIRIPRCR